MRVRWTLGLLGLVPLAVWLAPTLERPPIPLRTVVVADVAIEVPVEVEVEVEAALQLPDLGPEILGRHVWDGCTLRPAREQDADRGDLHVRTGYVRDSRLAVVLSEIDQAGIPGVHFGFYTAPRSLEVLRRWDDLRYLTFEGDHLDNDAMAPLADLRRLRMLEIGVRPYERNLVTDAGLRHLTGLRDLEYLGLHAFDGVTGEGLRYLMPLQSLTDLELSYTEVDDRSLRYLAPLKELRTLSLQHTRVTDAGLEHLRRLPELRTLDLRQTAVTPAAALTLAQFPSLERVVLRYNEQFEVIQAVRGVGLEADGIGWIRGTVGCEHWPRQ